jgi:NADPH2:quinone reductase
MQIIEVKAFGGPEVLRLIELPDPVPQPGQILVEVMAAGINFADIVARQGRYRRVPTAPFFPGFEVAGIVKQVGPEVQGFVTGDRVMGLITGGGYASLVALDASVAIKLPDELDFAVATSLLIQGLTAYFLLETGGLQQGGNVLVSSASGGVGSLAIQIARLKGAGKVIGLASTSKHDRIRALGVDAAIDYTHTGWADLVLKETGETGVGIFLDSQGNLDSEGFNTLGVGGHWIIFGTQTKSLEPLNPNRLGAFFAKNLTLRGYSVYYDVPRFGRALGEMIPWVTSGKLKVDVQSFPLSEAADAHIAISERRTIGKVVLLP